MFGPLLLLLFANSSWAGVREDWRACELGYLRTIKTGTPPRATAPAEQYCIGLAHWFQPSPFPRDPARAAQWHDAAARQNHPGAMVALGYQLERGQGVTANPAKAFDLCQRAAALGSPDGMFNVFRFYTTGKHVKANAAAARTWLDKAAAAGSEDAKKEMHRSEGADLQKLQRADGLARPAVQRTRGPGVAQLGAIGRCRLRVHRRPMERRVVLRAGRSPLRSQQRTTVPVTVPFKTPAVMPQPGRRADGQRHKG
ncbi:MAG: tetratricopeptide repeat protein [Casimicrobiaceae bacterium]